MNKGLKELKRLPKAIKDTFKDSFDIIKKELKDGEKNKQVLEILKNKVVFYWQLRFFENYDNYFIATYSEENKDNILTRNEFNLIKEWLKR